MRKRKKILRISINSQKRFTLIEVIIALSLSVVLLTFVMRFFTQMITMEKQLDQAREEIFIKQNIYIRLNQMFSQLSSFSIKNNSPEFIFYNGIDINPDFSGKIKARLYLKNNKFYLEQTSLEKKKSRKEILLKNVEFIKFKKKPTLIKATIKIVNQETFQLAFFLS